MSFVCDYAKAGRDCEGADDAAGLGVVDAEASEGHGAVEIRGTRIGGDGFDVVGAAFK